MKKLIAGLAAIAVLCVAPAFAHHSFAAEFDANKRVTMTGTFKKLEWTNPHAHFFLDVKDAKGAMVTWDFELASPNVLMRHGWSRNSLKPGETITAVGYLAKDGSTLANARSVTLPDGREIFAGSSYDDGSGQK
jgi:hypothetical protein